MNASRRVWIFALWILSLVVAGAWGQTPRELPPRLITADDIGFRIDRMRGEIPVGTLMVRIDGKWVEMEFSPRLKRAK